ncbi:MAG: CBS domain-containing protein [Gammaproteobacteria bacterium]|nr:CBS domain-containing protein [Gammaproteobacteria bacterium]
MSRQVVSVPPSAPLSDVVKRMIQHHVGAVIVVKSPASRPVPVGVVTDRDVVRALSMHAADLFTLSAGDVMSRDPLELNENDSLAAAIAKLRSRGVRRAPVLDQSGALVGVVSVDDLLFEVGRELAALVDLIAKQPRKEGTL